MTRPRAGVVYEQEAIENMTKLAEFKPMWIEEPTNCDDVIGHVSINLIRLPDLVTLTG
jgi:L-fuconate dehydratase